MDAASCQAKRWIGSQSLGTDSAQSGWSSTVPRPGVVHLMVPSWSKRACVWQSYRSENRACEAAM